jgi:hypothetical protein
MKIEEIKKKEVELDKLKQQAIKELLAQREEIDKQLLELGYNKGRRGRPPGSGKKNQTKNQR